MPKYAARIAARLHIWTAAPAPPRLFLPQAAARLRSQTQLPVSSAGRGRCVCLLRLANFPGGRRSALVKIGALRQRRLPVSSTGRGRRRCPCSASLYLPQAALGCAARRPLDVPPALRARPHMGALGHSMFPYPAALPELLDRVLRLLRSLHPEGAVRGLLPPKGDAAQRQGGFR